MKHWLVLSCLVLLGCATNLRIEDLSPTDRARVLSMEIIRGPAERPNTVIGQVSGLSCNRNAYQRQDISEEEALQGIKVHAARLGADAVINVICQKNSDTDWRNNCWASVKCLGEAVRYTG